MNKQEKQKMMDEGAVFEWGDLTYSKSTIYSDNQGEKISDREWENMTLKTPTPKKEYSREYVQMENEEMARLMIEGEALEFESGAKASFSNNTNHPSFVYDREGIARQTLESSWNAPCRVYQEPKEETRWLWVMNDDACEIKTKIKTTLAPFWLGDPDNITKIEGSEEQFQIEDK